MSDQGGPPSSRIQHGTHSIYHIGSLQWSCRVRIWPPTTQFFPFLWGRSRLSWPVVLDWRWQLFTASQKTALFARRQHRYFSYAICQDTDRFTDQTKLQSLVGWTLRVGFNSNSGGWKGAYQNLCRHFVGALKAWSTPMVDFTKHAAKAANFKIELVQPPSFFVRATPTLTVALPCRSRWLLRSRAMRILTGLEV